LGRNVVENLACHPNGAGYESVVVKAVERCAVPGRAAAGIPGYVMVKEEFARGVVGVKPSQ
jgi:hypothetical protein